MKFLRLLLILFVLPTFAQQGGMWIPSLLKGMNETEMKNLGMKITAEDIYSVNKSSFKDAVPHFDGGCTAEVISPKGLILTNHHCGYDNIQSHSTVEHDYLTNGFWAYKMDEELPNKDLFVTFIVRIEDITIKSISKELASLSALNLTSKRKFKKIFRILVQNTSKRILARKQHQDFLLMVTNIYYLLLKHTKIFVW